MAKVPASIRNKNPGAQYPGPSSVKFGSTGTEILRSGDGEHKIATFPTFEQGGAAMFDLLCRLYTGMTITAAIKKWCGGIRWQAYVAHITERTGATGDTKLTKATLADADFAISLCKAMADWECGKTYPMTEAQWAKAHHMAFSDAAPAVLEDAADVPPYVINAIAKLGMSEWTEPGRHNPAILADFAMVGRDDIKTDETASCAAFTGARLVETGYKLPAVPKADLLMARSYLKLPNEVKAANVRPGDLRIESRGPAPFGHVEIVVEVDHVRGIIKTIAGNVGNTVAYRTKPLGVVGKGVLLGYRRPSRGPAPIKFVVKATPVQMVVSAVLAFFAWLGGILDWAINYVSAFGHFVGWALGVLPDAIDRAAPHVGSVQQLSGWFGVSPGGWLLGAVASSAVATALWALWKSERAK